MSSAEGFAHYYPARAKEVPAEGSGNTAAGWGRGGESLGAGLRL